MHKQLAVIPSPESAIAPRNLTTIGTELAKSIGQSAAQCDCTRKRFVDFKDLQCFVAVYERGSFARAGLTLATAQSNVSMRVHRLEGALGAQLFKRGYSGAVPTAKGRVLYAHARKILFDIDELQTAMRQDVPLTSTVLTSADARRHPNPMR